MPSPVVHIGFTLGYGVSIMTWTKGSFTAIHCLVLAWNGFFGPDIGAFLGWCFTTFFPTMSENVMTYIHHSVGYVILISPIIAIIASKLSKEYAEWKSRRSNKDLSIENKQDVNINTVALSIKDSYLLSIAGCLLHFQIDHIFEENGQDKFYKWILSTGYFQKPTPPLSSLSVICVALSTCALYFGFAWIHLLSPSISKSSLKVKLKYTYSLLFTVLFVYGVFLFISQNLLEQVAIVGEEADLGVITFIVVYHLLPFILCLLSVHQ